MSINKKGSLSTEISAFRLLFTTLEAPPGFEPGNKGFADLSQLLD